MPTKENAVQVNLKKFDMKNSIKKPFNIAVIGKRNTGKSVLISEILYYLTKNKIPRACAISATEESNGFFCTFIPDTYIFDASDVENRLHLILESQKDLCMKQKLGQIPMETDLRIAIILDDIGFKKGALRSEIVKQIFMNGRHYHISIILAAQHVMQMEPSTRANCDFVLCLKESSQNAKEHLYKNFFSVFTKKKHFMNAFDAMTQNFGCLVLNNKAQSGQIDDIVNWYKATPDREFKLGSREFWKNHHDKYVTLEERYLIKAAKQGENSMVSSDGSIIINKHG